MANKQIEEKRELKKYHTKSWRSLATDPESWLISATNLKTAADAILKSLWPQKREHHDTRSAVADFYFGPVYMLLAGLAVETLIKGIIAGKNPEYIQRQKLSKELTHHNLIDLYRTAGLRENKSRNNLLLRLQNYVENFGRYPVTKTKQDMQKMIDTRFAGQTDPVRINRLWENLLTKIQAYIKSEE